MIETGIEDCLLVFGTIYAHVGKLFLPCRNGLPVDGIEIPSGILAHILLGIGDADRRQRDLYDERLTARSKAQIGLYIASVGPIAVGERLVVGTEHLCRDRTVELGIEAHLAVALPAIEHAVALKGVRVNKPHLGVEDFPNAVATVLKVEDEIAGLSLGEGIAVHARARRGRHLTVHATLIEPHLIVAGRGLFVVVAES